MRILITNDDGIKAFGLTVLREAARRRFKDAKIVTISTVDRQLGRGMGVRGESGISLEEIEQDVWISGGYPADIAYQAFCDPSKFLSVGTWDLVLSGVNEGANVGLDVLHSGTCAAPLMASAIFGCTAYAFSQQVVQGKEGTFKQGTESEKQIFEIAAKYLGQILLDLNLGTGECFNVNFPLRVPVATVSVRTAPYSRWRTVSNQQNIRHADRLNFDVERLNAGYITIAEMDLQINPSLRY